MTSLSLFLFLTATTARQKCNNGQTLRYLLQKAAPSPFLDCLLKRFRFTFVSSRLAWLLVSWFRPDLSPTLKPSGKLDLPPRVLAGLDMDDDMSPKPLSLLYDPTRFCEMARSFARSRDSIQSSAE